MDHNNHHESVVWWLLSLSVYLLLIKLYYVDGRMYLRCERSGMGEILREVSAASGACVHGVLLYSSQYLWYDVLLYIYYIHMYTDIIVFNGN